MKKVKVAKLSRALGVALTTKAVRFMEKRPYGPGQHGKAKRKTQSNFGKQLLEKQRLKAQYNITEKQLSNYFDAAKSHKGSTGANLLNALEARLDVVILRAGFAPTIYAARQMINHGHISVNGKRVNKRSYSVEIGDLVMPTTKGKTHPLIQATFAGAIRPPYISVNVDAVSASPQRNPERIEIPIICDEQMVVEYYSR